LNENLVLYGRFALEMRFFKIILAVYLLGLSLVPCSDETTDKDTIVTIEASSDSHSDHTGHEDNCTPFCNCSCCGVAVLIAQNFFLFEKPVFNSSELFYKPEAVLSISHSIWLPPKITLS
jgi:hypothetical protein